LIFFGKTENPSLSQTTPYDLKTLNFSALGKIDPITWKYTCAYPIGQYEVGSRMSGRIRRKKRVLNANIQEMNKIYKFPK